MMTTSYPDTTISNTRPLRVLWDTQLSSRNPTGMGVYANETMAHLRRHNITIQTLAGWYVPDTLQSVPAKALRAVANTAWNQLALPAALAYFRPDILHVPVLIAPAWGTVCPVVVTCHDIIYRLFPEHYHPLYARYLDWFVPRGLQHADVVIANSEATRRDIVEAYDIDPARIRVVYLGVDTKRFSPIISAESHQALQRYGIDPRDDYIIHFGTITARKNIPTILKAIGLLKARGRWNRRKLVLAGPMTPGMPGFDTVRETISRLRLEDDVLFTGKVSHADMPHLYTSAAMLVFPSLYEGFGLPVVEAMASGTPVVAAHGSSLTEVVGDAGILCPPTDHEAFAEAILRVLEDTTMQQTLREQGLQRAPRFNWEQAAQQTVAIYAQLAANR